MWILTETWAGFSPGEDKEFRLVAESCAATDLERWPDRRWVAIWVKSSVPAKPVEVHDQPDRMVCGRIENLGQRNVVVVGAVLPWPGDPLFPKAADFCAALTTQVAQWRSLWGTPAACDFIVAGDFNLPLPYQRFFGPKKGEKVLLEVLTRHDLFCLTPGNDPLTDRPRIDHICISRSGLQPPFLPQVGTWAIPCIGGEPITDHSGDYADLDAMPDPKKHPNNDSVEDHEGQLRRKWIEENAYFRWVDEEYPDGQDFRHWIESVAEYERS